jgi:ABC-type branched-subunit amino acid transport system ATPase component
MSGSALEITRLSVSYGAVRAASDVALAVPSGTCIALVGANGAGKTSILRGVSGLMSSRSGAEIRLAERDVSRMDACGRARAGLGHVLEGRHIFSGLSVQANLRLGAACARSGDPEQAVADVLEMLPELRPALDKPGGTLSGGQQQMLAIGRALVARPTVLLMDEPTNGLAPILVERVVEIIREITARDIGVLLVEQRLEVATAVGERVHVLQRGRIIEETAGDDDRLPALVHAAYLS